MLNIDELIVMASKEHLTDRNACTDLLGSTDWCGDDERADIINDDAFAWFNDHFATKVKKLRKHLLMLSSWMHCNSLLVLLHCTCLIKRFDLMVLILIYFFLCHP